MRTTVIFTACVYAGIFSLAAGNLSAESYLDSGASETQIKRALLNTRTLTRQRSEGRGNTASQSNGRAGRASTSTVKGKDPGGSRGASARSAEARSPETSPKSTGSDDGGPASFEIYFDVNSANLRADAYPVLDRLGSALRSQELNDYRFVVEGHTDATGSEAFNLELSQNRAQSVREYLVGKYDIDPARLEPVGRGESELYDPEHPDSGKNRRVRFVNADEAEY